jgi:hypothetical protein
LIKDKHIEAGKPFIFSVPDALFYSRGSPAKYLIIFAMDEKWSSLPRWI